MLENGGQNLGAAARTAPLSTVSSASLDGGICLGTYRKHSRHKVFLRNMAHIHVVARVRLVGHDCWRPRRENVSDESGRGVHGRDWRRCLRNSLRVAGSPRSSESEQGVERVAERGQGVSPGEPLAAARPSDVLQSRLSEGELGSRSGGVLP